MTRSASLLCALMLTSATLQIFGAEATAPEPGIGWLPGKAQLALRIRASDLRGSSLFRRLLSSKPLFRDEMTHLDRLVSRAGVDLARDVDVAWIATDGRRGGESVALLMGRLDPVVLAPRLRPDGVAPREGEVRIYALPPAGGGAAGRAVSADTVVAFPRKGIALAGTRSWVRLALERGSGEGASLTDSPSMGALMKKLDAGATIWSAAAGGAVAAKVQSEFQGQEFGSDELGAVSGVVASFRIAADVRIDSEALSATEEDAGLLSLTLRGVIAMGGLQASSDGDLYEAFQSLRVDRTSRGVRVTGRIPAAVAMRM